MEGYAPNETPHSLLPKQLKILKEHTYTVTCALGSEER